MDKMRNTYKIKTWREDTT